MKKKTSVFLIIFAFMILSLNTSFGAELSTVAKFIGVSSEQSNKIYKIDIELQDITSLSEGTQVVLSGNIDYDTNLFTGITLNGENGFSGNLNVSNNNQFILDGSYVNDKLIGEIVLEIGDISETTDTQINLTNISILTDAESDEYSNMNTKIDVQLNKNINIAGTSSEKSIEVLQTPKKIEYVQNDENLDVNGGKIEVTYNDGTTREIEMTDSEIELTGFDNSSIGTNMITVKYKGLTTTFDVSIVGNTPGSEVLVPQADGDLTVARNIIPQTGKKLLIVFCVIALISLVVMGKKYILIRKDMSGK